MSCEYCSGGSKLISGETVLVNDIFLFGTKDEDSVPVKEVKENMETNKLEVFLDRGFLRLCFAHETQCLDSGLGKIRVHYCPICGDMLAKK